MTPAVTRSPRITADNDDSSSTVSKYTAYSTSCCQRSGRSYSPDSHLQSPSPHHRSSRDSLHVVDGRHIDIESKEAREQEKEEKTPREDRQGKEERRRSSEGQLRKEAHTEIRQRKDGIRPAATTPPPLPRSNSRATSSSSPPVAPQNATTPATPTPMPRGQQIQI